MWLQVLIPATAFVVRLLFVRQNLVPDKAGSHPEVASAKVCAQLHELRICRADHVGTVMPR